MRLRFYAVTAFIAVVGSAAAVPVLHRPSAAARAISHRIGDCSVAYFPDLSKEPVEWPSYIGESARLWPAREFAPGELAVEPAEDVAPGARREHFEDATGGWTSTVMPSADGGCNRVILGVSPVEIGAGVHKTTVCTRGAPVTGQWSGHGDCVEFPEVSSGKNMGKGIAYVYNNGTPARGASILIFGDVKGNPGRHGAGVGHEHLYSGQHATSLRFSAENSTACASPLFNGQARCMKTDNDGQAVFGVQGGHRGGVETVRVRYTFGSTTMEDTQPVVITVFPRLVDFAQSMHFKGRPTPGTTFPFILVGEAAGVHQFNHYVQSGLAPNIVLTLLSIWSQDEATRKAAGGSRWIQLNDMSLEYGGDFKLSQTEDCNTSDDAGSHHSHERGLDFDIAPCYTHPDGSKIGAGECFNSRSSSGQRIANGQSAVHVSERVLAANIIGGGRGVIFIHQVADNAPYHYHIRLNPKILGAGTVTQQQ